MAAPNLPTARAGHDSRAMSDDAPPSGDAPTQPLVDQQLIYGACERIKAQLELLSQQLHEIAALAQGLSERLVRIEQLFCGRA